jgi:hypothetical protein
MWSPDTIVGIAASLRARLFGFDSQQEQLNFLFSKTVLTGSKAHLVSYSVGTGFSFEDKAAGV